MDKKKLRNWILAGVLGNLLVMGLFCLHIFPFQALEMRRIAREKDEAEVIYLEFRTAPEMGAQIEKGIAALEESLARFPYIHCLDPAPLLLQGLEEASRIARADVEKIFPLPPSPAEAIDPLSLSPEEDIDSLPPSPEEGKGVTRLSWRVTVGADSYMHLKRFFAALEPLPFLVSGEDFSLTVKEDQRLQAQFIIFAFLGE